MTRRKLFATILLLTVALTESVAQALTDRYHGDRPVLIAYERAHKPYSFTAEDGSAAGYYIDVAKALMERMDLNYQFVAVDYDQMWEALERRQADLILTEQLKGKKTEFSLSRNIVSYSSIADSHIAEIHFAGRDRQLIEQMDDRYMRLLQEGGIAKMREQWLHPELEHKRTVSAVVLLAVGLLLLVVMLTLACVLMKLSNRHLAHRCTALSKLISQVRQMGQYYAEEDTRAAHELLFGYESILRNPFIAISFYDNNGKLILQNEAMRRLGQTDVTSLRHPIYNRKGQVSNYYVIIPVKTT